MTKTVKYSLYICQLVPQTNARHDMRLTGTLIMVDYGGCQEIECEDEN